MSRPLPLPPSHHRPCSFLFFFHDTATTEIYTLSLHDALPICDDWPGFFLSFRLEPQLNRAGLSLGFSSLEKFFKNHKPAPSLLHGDLWNGNVGFTADGPVIFDPAVYYGDREADLAMTELFGGFPAEFYGAYSALLPLHP